MGGEARGDLGLDVLEGGVGVGFGDGSEDGEDAGEETAGLLHRYEGVFECGGGEVVGDAVDLGALLGHAGFDGGQVVGVFYFVEGWSLIGEGAGGVEGIGGVEGFGAGVMFGFEDHVFFRIRDWELDVLRRCRGNLIGWVQPEGKDFGRVRRYASTIRICV